MARVLILLLACAGPLLAAGGAGLTSDAVGGVILLLAIGLPLVLVARRLGVSTLVSYLALGFVVSDHALGLVDRQAVAPLGDLGATLLLFGIGLELDLLAMRRQLREILIGAVGQICSTVVVGALLMMVAGTGWRPSIAIGACLALSSTLMVLRALEAENLRNKPVGRLVLGLLLTQDIALAPLLVLIALVLPGADAVPLWQVGLAMVAVLAATWFARQVLASRLVNRIRAAQLPELEVAFSVVVALGAAYLAEVVGLGAAIGAFCAGLALGGDEHRHAIETSTRPLQGLLAIVFFASIGFQFDPAFVTGNAIAVALALIVSVALKAALAGFALRLAGLPLAQAVGAGIMVGQVGEFSFVLAARLAVSDDPDLVFVYQLIVSVSCLSLALTPFLVRLALRFLPRSRLDQVTRRGDAVVVAGLGPVGNTVVESLHAQGLPLFLVDRNPRLLDPWRGTSGIGVHQGKIEDLEDWLPVLGHRPRVVILTFPIPDTSAVVTERLRQHDPDLVVVARSPYLASVDMLHNAGAQYVLCDERAVALSLDPVLDDALGRTRKADDPNRNNLDDKPGRRSTAVLEAVGSSRRG